MRKKSLLRACAVILIATALAGCGQALLIAYSQAMLDSETPESMGEAPANYRGKSCLELAVERQGAMILVNHVGDSQEYVQKRGRWQLAAVEQVEREQGCLAGTTVNEAGDIEFVAKNPQYAKEFNLPKGAKIPPSTSASPSPPPVRSKAKASASSSPPPGISKASPPTTAQIAKTPSSFSRGWLGVYVQERPIAPVLATALGMPESKGVFVPGALEDGAAATAGMRALDVVLSADGNEFNNGDALLRYLSSLPVGHQLKLKVWRNRALHDMQIPLSASAPDINLPKNVAGYCYVIALPDREPATNNLVWASYVFPIPYEHASLVLSSEPLGESFRKYVEQMGLPLPSRYKGLGICHSSLKSINGMWEPLIAGFNSKDLNPSESAGVLLNWKPF